MDPDILVSYICKKKKKKSHHQYPLQQKGVSSSKFSSPTETLTKKQKLKINLEFWKTVKGLNKLNKKKVTLKW